MRVPALAVFAVLLSGAAQAMFLSSAAQAATDVTFKNADSYADATFEWPKSEKNRAKVRDEVTKMFAKLADKYLASGQSLTVEVTEIDLAGRLEPMADDIRIMRSVTWPRLRFTYTVHQDGAVVRSGDANLSDMNYLAGFNRYMDSDRLRYERQMLTDWFRKTLAQGAT